MIFRRRVFLLPALLFAGVPLIAATALPAPVDVAIFSYDLDGQHHKLVVTTSPTLVRIDKLDEGLSVIYDPQTQFFTGLENQNYTYWDFSWPQVSAVVQNSKRYESRLQELGNEGLNGDLPPPTTNAPTASALSPDDSGYVWRPTTERKRVAGIDCVRWTADSLSGEPVEAWCAAGLLPKVQVAIAKLREINEPMALVPVRTLAPDFIFPVYSALARGGVTPLEIAWGGESQKNWFTFVEARTRDGKPELFAVPKLYIKTTLVTMDGMLDQKK